MITLSGHSQLQNYVKFREPIVSASAAPTWTNLLSWWKMTESGGGTAYDSHGSDDGTVTGATQSTDGITFDGSGDYVDITGHVVSGSATFLFWCRPNGDPDCDVFGQSSGAGALKATMWLNYRFRIMKAGGAGSSVVSLALTNASWNFVSIVVNGAANTVRFGVNGSYETETDWNSIPDAHTDRIGASTYDLGEFVGDLKEFAWFSDTKSDAYITAFYNSGAGTAYEDGDPA